MKILGISAYYHDSAAVLLSDGEILAATQEERFTRKKHDSNFPHQGIAFALKQAGITPAEIDLVCFYDKPFLKFERLLETYLTFAPRGFLSFLKAIPVWVREKIFLKSLLVKELNKIDPNIRWDERLLFSEHHLSHAASAFFPSPFADAIVLTMDGVGEWTTTSVAYGKGNSLQIQKEIHFPHSLGLLYSAFTYYTGFKVNSGEYKVMGLAPYGKPVYVDTIKKHLIDIKDDGSFRLNLEYFDYCTGLRMTNEKFAALFGGPARKSEDQVTQREMDLAASIQAVTEEVVLKLCRALAKENISKNLCLAGGVALNCVANGKILEEKIFDHIWIQPAAGDAGGALGAAMVAHYMFKNQPRLVRSTLDGMKGSYLGPVYPQAEVEERLRAAGAVFHSVDENAMLEFCVDSLKSEKALGWHQGRMEFGPRALGARSILGDPRSSKMQSTLNLKIKYRESFRPFAPSVLREDVGTWFQLAEDSPYMLLVAGVAPQKRREMSEDEKKLFGIEKLNVSRSEIPAVTHVDYSARVQTVHEETNPLYYRLLKRFKEKTGCPVVVNTSFNVRGEPIVCTPEDSFRCFMGTEMDALVVGNCILRKEEQNPALRKEYLNKFELD